MKQFVITFKVSEKENPHDALKRKHIRIPINGQETGGIELNLHNGNLSKKWFKRIAGISE